MARPLVRRAQHESRHPAGRDDVGHWRQWATPKPAAGTRVSSRHRHATHVHPCVALGRADTAGFERRLPEGHTVGLRMVGNPAGAVVPDVRHRRRHAAARLTCASACTMSKGMRCSPMAKKRRLRAVCAPHRASPGTSMDPKLSVSVRGWRDVHPPLTGRCAITA